jgi:DNA-binding NarL/FixJ family response regulator
MAQTTISTTDETISVYLVDDQAMLRAAFRSWIQQSPGLTFAGEAGDATTALAEMARLQPDVVLLDITMPGLSGLDALPAMRERCPDSRILMVTNLESESAVQDAVDRGAHGYLSKSSDPSELAVAIRSVVSGQSFISPRVAGSILAGRRPDARPASGLRSLTPREREVFLHLAAGRTNKEVAGRLSISLATAKKHRENLQRKLRCRSSADLARLAIREGLMPT